MMTRTLPVPIAYGKVMNECHEQVDGRWVQMIIFLSIHQLLSQRRWKFGLMGWEERYQDSLTCCVKRIQHVMSGKGERDFGG